MVFHGNRLEDLRDLTVGLLRNNPLPPLVPETLLVQSNGMKHWLEMALADDSAMGICAATQTELPSSFVWRMYRLVLGQDVVPVAMPFDKQALVWRLWRLLPEFAQTHQAEALLAYVKDDPLGRQRYQLAQQVADVFDGYQSYRADWLTDWAKGQFVLHHQGAKPWPQNKFGKRSCGNCCSKMFCKHRCQSLPCNVNRVQKFMISSCERYSKPARSCPKACHLALWYLVFPIYPCKSSRPWPL